MLLKLLNMFLVDHALAISVLPTKPPEGVPDLFGGGEKEGGVSTAGDNLADIISFIFDFVIAISGGIFVIMFLIGGVTYLTGAGNDEQTSKGKKMLIDAVVGIFIVLVAWGIGTYVINVFKTTNTNTKPSGPLWTWT